MKHADEEVCSYPSCDKQGYAYAYWLPHGNPKHPLCKGHFDQAEFVRWYLTTQKEG